MMFQIHNYGRRLESVSERIKRSDISESNKTLILKFKEECFVRGLGIPRIEKYICTLFNISKFGRFDFKKAKKKDIINLVSYVEKNDRWTDWTKHDYKLTIKNFFSWINKRADYKWISLKVKNSNHRLPEDILTEEEVKRLLEHTNNLRNKALIACLYESGCRIGEILSLRLKHVQFLDIGAQIIVNGKTGMRRVLLISSVPYLSSWLNAHPNKETQEAPLWNSTDNYLSYGACNVLLRHLAKKAGIKKRVNPHSFRHARATHLANHLTEAQMKQYFGWVQGSDMASIYVHLSGRDVDSAILKVYGLEKNDVKEKETALKPRTCPRCSYINPATGRLCGQCGLALDLKTAMEIDDKTRKLNSFLSDLIKNNPEIQKMMLREADEK